MGDFAELGVAVPLFSTCPFSLGEAYPSPGSCNLGRWPGAGHDFLSTEDGNPFMPAVAVERDHQVRRKIGLFLYGPLTVQFRPESAYALPGKQPGSL